MRAGDLRRRVTFQTRSTTQDALNAQVNTWADLATVWADVRPLSGHELFTAQAVMSEVTHQITIRYQAQFSNTKAVSAMRILYNGRIFNLHACMNVDERSRVIDITASEGLNDG